MPVVYTNTAGAPHLDAIGPYSIDIAKHHLAQSFEKANKTLLRLQDYLRDCSHWKPIHPQGPEGLHAIRVRHITDLTICYKVAFQAFDAIKMFNQEAKVIFLKTLDWQQERIKMDITQLLIQLKRFEQQLLEACSEARRGVKDDGTPYRIPSLRAGVDNAIANFPVISKLDNTAAPNRGMSIPASHEKHKRPISGDHGELVAEKRVRKSDD